MAAFSCVKLAVFPCCAPLLLTHAAPLLCLDATALPRRSLPAFLRTTASFSADSLPHAPQTSTAPSTSPSIARSSASSTQRSMQRTRTSPKRAKPRTSSRSTARNARTKTLSNPSLACSCRALLWGSSIPSSPARASRCTLLDASCTATATPRRGPGGVCWAASSRTSVTCRC